MYGKNPETLLMRKQQQTIDGLAREYSAKAALRSTMSGKHSAWV